MNWLEAKVWLLVTTLSVVFLLAASRWGIPEIERQINEKNAAQPSTGALAPPPTWEHAFWTSMVLTTILILAIFILTHAHKSAAATKPGATGIVTMLTGADGRLSTGKTQAAIWTWAVALALLYMIGLLLASAVWGPHGFGLLAFEFPEAYLVLLGGPFAAMVVAKAATVDALGKQELQKTKSTAAPRAVDLLANDNGEADLVDAQYLVFNLVLLAWFAVSFARLPAALPAIPGSLLALTGISAATYATTKGVFKNPPLITAIVPVTKDDTVTPPTYGLLPSGEVKASSLLEVRGSNLIPTGTSGRQPAEWMVHFKNQVDLKPTAESIDPVKGAVRVIAPDQAGQYWVSVITPTEPAIESGAVQVTIS